MRIGLFTKNKIGVIEGTCKKKNFRKELHDQLDKCYEFILSWTMNVLIKELYISVVYALFMYNVWKDLKERFDKRNISRVYNLDKEIIAFKQGLSHVSTY